MRAAASAPHSRARGRAVRHRPHRVARTDAIPLRLPSAAFGKCGQLQLVCAPVRQRFQFAPPLAKDEVLVGSGVVFLLSPAPLRYFRLAAAALLCETSFFALAS